MVRPHKSDQEDTSYWMSYSDMMAALLLVFVLVISFTMLQAKKSYEKKETELIEQQALVKKTQKLIDEQKDTLNQQQQMIDKIVGVRSEVVSDLSKEFANTDLSVKLDEQTGAIILDSNILFDVNEYEVKDSGRQFLDEFLPRYISVLLKPKFKDYISEIIIEGHTDTDGTYMHNLELSQNRALSVASYCLDAENGSLDKAERKRLRELITANGRSYSNPIQGVDGSVDKKLSRRVEFKFRLKEQEMVEEMSEIMSGE